MPNYLNDERKVEELYKQFEDRKPVTIKMYGKEIKVHASTTLNELQEDFGGELDMLDIFRADWFLEEVK